MLETGERTEKGQNTSHEQRHILSRLPWLLPMAAGIFLGTAIFEMLPQALDRAGTRAWLWAPAGFAGFLLLHKGLDGLQHAGAAWVSSLGMWLHSLLEGLMIATGYGISLLVGVLLSLGLAFHLLPEAIALCALLRATGSSMKQALVRTGISWILIIAGLLGAGTLRSSLSPVFVGAGLALGAGALVYLAHLSWIERRGSLGTSLAVALLPVLVMGAIGLTTG